MSQGFLLVISGPSGCGKGTVSKALLERNSDIVFSISATTRKRRVGEEDGINYFFMDEEEFCENVEKNEFLEHAFVHNNYYGTPRDFVLKEIEKGEIVLLEIDVQGAMQVKKNYKNVVFVFLLPPTMAELKDRITKRGTETPEDIQRRFENAFEELNFVGEYDYFVVNDKVENAVLDIENIICAEKLRVKRHSDIKEKIISQGGK
ncbi:guanylate kinase [Tissierella creatinophila]|uniref:Guanylate kinase n=1 Tax=Tissierella creatinophila DSM 6911 TaxID=1123403 RepID=A0A1U7M306_TISCR|nr:guanylate kinase [Tissierella creatinophila]OLS01703.1 guanylate kinase [Tissierella creatinophila DSM 6911]